MTETLHFANCNRGSGDREALHYRSFGVDGIYLKNGFERVPDEGYGAGYIVYDADDLHKTIGISLHEIADDDVTNLVFRRTQERWEKETGCLRQRSTTTVNDEELCQCADYDQSKRNGFRHIAEGMQDGR